jgi:hypothetical protein
MYFLPLCSCCGCILLILCLKAADIQGWYIIMLITYLNYTYSHGILDARDTIGHQDAVLLCSRMWDFYHVIMRSWHKLFGVVVDGSNQACPGRVLQGPQKIRSHSHTSCRASSYKLETGSLCFRQRWYRFLSNRSHIFTFQSSACFWENPINM